MNWDFVMRKLLNLYLLFLFSASSYSSEFKPVVAVYPAWKHTASSIQTIPWQRFSHLAVAGIYPKEDGSLLTENVDSFLQELVTKSHANGKKVVISIGGAGNASQGFIAITKNQEKIDFFIKNVSNYVDRYHLDGVDIDWEYWTYQHKLNQGGQDPIESSQLVSLMKSLRNYFPPSFILSVDVAPGNWIGEQYQLALQDYVTYVNLMAFDFTGAWESSKIAYHSDIPTFDKALDYMLKRGFDPSKIIVGLPAYGIEFVDGKNKKIKHMDYKDIVEMLGADAQKISKSRIKNIYFEDQESIKKKCLLVNKRKIGGVFIFNILSDHESDNFSLLVSCNKLIQPVSFLKDKL